MISFGESLEKTMNAVICWEEKAKLKNVTIVRDVLGKITVLIETDGEVEIEKIGILKALMEQKLEKRFSGRIYCDANRNSDLVKAMIDEIKRLRWQKEDKNGIRWFVLERAIAKKAWIECSHSQNAIWSYTQAVKGKTPKVVTFYSFKGGMGRTTALAATALALAQEGKNVLALDTDIEAPGLASLFFDAGNIHGGTVDYLLEATVTPENEKIDMSKLILQVGDGALLDGLQGQIFIIPSGKMDDNYLQKLARIDYQDTKPENMKNQLIRLIKDAVDTISKVCKIDYVLLDARAGFHDMAGVITAQLPHGVVLLGKDSTQSWQGMKLVLETIANSQTEKPLIAMIDSACGTDGLISMEEKKRFRDKAYMTCCDTYYEADEQPGPKAPDEAHSPIFVPYQPSLAQDIQLFSDGTAERDELVHQRKKLMLGECYQEIKKRLLQWFDGEETLDE